MSIRTAFLRKRAALVYLALAMGLAVGASTQPRQVTAQSLPLGRILVGHLGQLWVIDEERRFPLTHAGRYWGHGDWSPSGGQVALAGWGDSFSDLFVLDLGTAELKQLTDGELRLVRDRQWAFRPRWAPDGQSIAYLSDRGSDYGMLWLVRPEGGGARQLVRPRGFEDAIDSFSWSPDSTRIAATRFNRQISQIEIIDVTRPGTSRPVTTEPGGAFDPAWSPDGRYLAYAAREGRNVVIRVLDMEGDGAPSTVVQTNLARSPAWSPDGHLLAYLALAGQDFELFVTELVSDQDGQVTTGRPAQLTTGFGIETTSGISWGL